MLSHAVLRASSEGGGRGCEDAVESLEVVFYIKDQNFDPKFDPKFQGTRPREPHHWKGLVQEIFLAGLSSKIAHWETRSWPKYNSKAKK